MDPKYAQENLVKRRRELFGDEKEEADKPLDTLTQKYIPTPAMERQWRIVMDPKNPQIQTQEDYQRLAVIHKLRRAATDGTRISVKSLLQDALVYPLVRVVLATDDVLWKYLWLRDFPGHSVNLVDTRNTKEGGLKSHDELPSWILGPFSPGRQPDIDYDQVPWRRWYAWTRFFDRRAMHELCLIHQQEGVEWILSKSRLPQPNNVFASGPPELGNYVVAERARLLPSSNSHRPYEDDRIVCMKHPLNPQRFYYGNATHLRYNHKRFSLYTWVNLKLSTRERSDLLQCMVDEEPVVNLCSVITENSYTTIKRGSPVSGASFDREIPLNSAVLHDAELPDDRELIGAEGKYPRLMYLYCLWYMSCHRFGGSLNPPMKDIEAHNALNNNDWSALSELLPAAPKSRNTADGRELLYIGASHCHGDACDRLSTGTSKLDGLPYCSKWCQIMPENKE